MIHILNNMTSDNDLQLVTIEKRVNDKVNPLTIDEIKDDLNLRFERLNKKANEQNESKVVEDLTLFGVQFKRKCRNHGGHRS
jgi:hypothetical protein